MASQNEENLKFSLFSEGLFIVDGVPLELEDVIKRKYGGGSGRFFLDELARLVSYSSFISWEKALLSFFQDKKDYIDKIPDEFSQASTEFRDIGISHITYLLILLDSLGLFDIKRLDPVTCRKIDEVSRKILFSYLVSKYPEAALSFDEQYVLANYGSILNARRFHIDRLIVDAVKDRQYMNIIESGLSDNAFRFCLYQEVLKFIKSEDYSKLDNIREFLKQCIQSTTIVINELLSDLLELPTVRSFLSESYKTNLARTIYSSISRIQLSGAKMPVNTLKSFNRFKNQLVSTDRLELSLVAREEIAGLSSKTLSLVTSRIDKLRSSEISEYIKVIPGSNTKWSASDYAHDLVAKADVQGTAIDIFKLARDMGFTIDIINELDLGFEACLINNVASPFSAIMVNGYNRPIGRIRFSVAHELAHGILPKHSNIFVCSADDILEGLAFKTKNYLEKEANEFAEELLLPRNKYRSETAKLDFTFYNLNITSKEYEVSLILAAVRWVKLSDLQIAIIIRNAEGMVKWWWPSNEFPFNYEQLRSRSEIMQNVNEGTTRIPSSSWFKEDQDRYWLLEETQQWYNGQYISLIQIGDDY